MTNKSSKNKIKNLTIGQVQQLMSFQPKKAKTNQNSKRGKQNVSQRNVTSRALVLRAQPSATLTGGRQQSTENYNTGNRQGLPQFIIASIDPFCEQAFGCKVPDQATMPSAVAFSRDLVPISIGATFAGAGYVFRFDSNAGFVPLVPTSSTSWTAPTYASATSTSNAAALSANYGLIRTVAFGIKLETRQSAFNAGGFLHIALVPEQLEGSTTFIYPTSVNGMEYAPSYKRIPIADLIEDEITVAGKYSDPGTAFRYLAPNFSDVSSPYTPGFPSSGWSAIMVWVEAPGLSLANAVDVEILHHYEAMTLATGVQGIIDITPAAPHSPSIMAAASFVSDRVDPIQVNREDEENKSTFWTRAMKLFPIGVKIASGIFPILTPLSDILGSMKI
jgi:hypothetical protein